MALKYEVIRKCWVTKLRLIALGTLCTTILITQSAFCEFFTLTDTTPSSSTLNYVGAWSGSNAYKVHDIVLFAGSLFVSTASTSPVNTAPSPNLFDPDAVVNNTVILWGTGAEVSIGGFQSSGYVNVAGASAFVTNITVGVFEPYGVAFYDATKKYISGTKMQGNGFYNPGSLIQVPLGANYARFWWMMSNMGTPLGQAIVSAGNVLPSTYTPYGGGGSNPSNPGSSSASPNNLAYWAPFPGTNPIAVAPMQTTVRASASTPFSAISGGALLTGGMWSLMGGVSQGIIDQWGNYSAPQTVPQPNHVTVTYSLGSFVLSTGVDILNPLPVISSLSPAVLNSLSMPVVITGKGFTRSSAIIVNGDPIATTFVDMNHLSGTIALSSPTVQAVLVSVSNSGPGAAMSAPYTENVSIPNLSVTPTVLSGGPVMITISGLGFPAESLVFLDGKQLTTVSQSSNSIVVKGFLPPWKTGATTLSVVSSNNPSATQTLSVPISPTATAFDAAARFTTQAAFGPRPDVVGRIQRIGMSSWITEQFSLPPVAYDPSNGGASKTQFIKAATSGSSLLRLRIAWGLQNFLVSQGTFQSFSSIPYEMVLERDASGNFRQLLTDLASDASVSRLLNLAGNPAPSDPSQHPNQNFARELMQLFSLGTNLLNDDGTLQMDAHGRAIPTYTQDQVVDLSRVFTGWNYPPPVDSRFTGYEGFDYSQPLVGTESQHDQGVKNIVGGTTIAASQGIVRDRQLALDAIFQHQNLPPFISRLLIQHLVKSAPSPAYVQRISNVFKDDGTGVRGNLRAVITAILLDEEARSGDLSMSADDGFLQEPGLFQFFVGSTTELPVWDDQTDYYGGQLGQDWWNARSVFGFYHPDYVIPGTSINSPEFQIFNNLSAINRCQVLWAMLTGTGPGYGTNYSSWLYSNFGNTSDLLDAIDHLAFHGQMPAAQKAAILTYCQQLSPSDMRLQFQSALFLALNSDSFTVTH